MKRIVLDCSVTMAWCFREERTSFTLGVLDKIKESGAVVPPIWPFEVLNTLAVSERRNRLDKKASAKFLELLSDLPILIDSSATWPPKEDFLVKVRKYRLTAYDTAYLDLAIRREAPLATVDQDLVKAARRAAVDMVKMAPPKKPFQE